jgi:transcriptional regulator with XRE-family HTH domain
MGSASKTTPYEFGEALRTTRSAAGIALETIAERTKISVRTLSALEAGDFARLPNRVFARMFLRQILELMGRSADEWMPAFEAAWQRFEESRHFVPEQPAVPIRRRRVGPWLVGLALVAVGVAAVLQLQKGPSEVPRPVPEASPQPVAAAAPTPAPPQPTVTPQVEPGVLVIRTGQAPCWVEVRVAGEKATSRLLAADTTWEVPAAGRDVELVLGDAGAASVEYLGEVRSPAGASGAVARFRMAGSRSPGVER